MNATRPTYNALTMRGRAYHGLHQPDLHLREAKPGVIMDDLKPHLEGNGRDEIVFETDDKRLFVLDAHWMETLAEVAPKVGDNIQLGDLKGSIVHTDNEKPNDIRAMLASISLLLAGAMIGGPAGLFLAGSALPACMILEAPKSDTTGLDALTETIAHSPKGSLRAIELMIQMKMEAAG